MRKENPNLVLLDFFQMNELFKVHSYAGAGASSRKQAIDQVNMNIEWIKSREANLLHALETISQS